MKRRSSRKSMRGRGFMDFLKSAGSFLSKSKLISTIGSALGAAGVPFAGAIGSAAGAVGFGKHRRRGHGMRHGRGVSLAGAGTYGRGLCRAGSGTALAGAGRRRRKH